MGWRAACQRPGRGRQCLAAVVRGLIEAGALVATELPEFAPFRAPDPDFAAPTLNPEQAAAARGTARGGGGDSIFRPSARRRHRIGQDGSLFRSRRRGAGRRGKQVLILLPEIALTVQFLERFAARFGCRPAEWHSDLSQKERRRVYRAVMNGEARVVVGARSSLFLPFNELGLIIVDEEHEQAYKQEDGAIYHARDMAVVRARIENCPVVLASATPSLESFVNATSGRYAHLKLTRAAWRGEDAGGAADRSATRTRSGRSRAESAMAVAAAARRAGRDAGGRRAGDAVPEPPRLCAADAVRSLRSQIHLSALFGLAGGAHYRKRLACHQCGYEMPMPSQCPQCHETDTLIACGPGVERVAEEFAAFFPQARYAIASSDT